MTTKARIAFAYLKIFYLYLTYWLVGLTEEGFQYKKAWYLTEIGNYHAAIYALKKSVNNLKAGYVYGLLGWCYIQLEDFENALEYYSKAYAKDQSPTILLGLAVSECHAGSLEKSKSFYQQLLPYSDNPYLKQSLDKLNSEYARRSNA